MAPNISRGLGKQGNKAIYFRGTREQKLKLKGTVKQRQFRGTGNKEHQYFDFGNKGKCQFFQENKGIDTPAGRASFINVYSQLFTPEKEKHTVN